MTASRFQAAALLPEYTRGEWIDVSKDGSLKDSNGPIGACHDPAAPSCNFAR